MNNTVFLEVEKLFTDELYAKTDKIYERRVKKLKTKKPGTISRDTSQTNQGFCCDEEDQDNLLKMTDIIKNIPEFSTLSDRDIYIVLIFIYYSLRLNEQNNDWLGTGLLIRHAENRDLSMHLLLSLTTGDIIINDSGNLSSAIRRYVLEMRDLNTMKDKGGNKMKKHTKINKNTLKKNKKHNKKTKQKTKRNN
jgi:hypothetical protein